MSKVGVMAGLVSSETSLLVVSPLTSQGCPLCVSLPVLRKGLDFTLPTMAMRYGASS